METVVTTDTAGASRHTRLSISYLEKARVTGEGPRYCKLGRRVVYRIADLDEWMADRVIGSTSETVAV